MPSSESNEHKPQQHASNLYYRHHQPRTRRTPSYSTPEGKIPPAKPPPNPAKEAVVGYIKKITWALLFMAVFLFVSINILKMTWSRHAKEVAPQPQNATNQEEIVSATTNRSAPPSTKANTEMPTDPIRAALVLAKRGETLELTNTEEAIKYYRRALDTWSNLPRYWAKLGALYLEVKDYPKAQMALEKAYDSGTADTKVINDLGVVYLYIGKTEQASQFFQKAIKLDPSFAPSYFNMALCYLNGYQRDAAEEWLNRFLALSPDDPQGLRELAVLRVARHHYQEALTLLQKAMTTSRDWPLLYLDAAATSAFMGHDDDALNYLKQAQVIAPPSVIYRIYQGDAFEKIRFTDEGKRFENELEPQVRANFKTPPNANNFVEGSAPISSKRLDTDQK